MATAYHRAATRRRHSREAIAGENHGRQSVVHCDFWADTLGYCLLTELEPNRFASKNRAGMIARSLFGGLEEAD
ncbi:hypothetical protein [Novipirellula sp.]|uniref:hypothetical protein n=1 Tax=Novipirellula sp. TaxID=2795430 RepID=UPI00356145F4